MPGATQAPAPGSPHRWITEDGRRGEPYRAPAPRAPQTSPAALCPQELEWEDALRNMREVRRRQRAGMLRRTDLSESGRGLERRAVQAPQPSPRARPLRLQAALHPKEKCAWI
uniref:Uncharacterized protein n=1 Tax=Rangifer tarandus platyrhynchus TaxID=3082113 RepID=A0ACB0FGW9_RANTA|nr:unnamed protein product [Rangifer tarandus platyrhynchus]